MNNEQRFNGEWETKRLGDLGNCLRGVNYDPTTDLSSYDKDSTVRLLRANNIQEAVVILSDVQYVEARKVSEFQFMQPHDILVCMANGSKELVGKAGLFCVKDGYTYTFGAFMGCFRVEPTIAAPNFVFYIFQTHGFRNFINLILAGSSINNLKPSDIESAEFQIPSRKEQRAIAEVLSDVDGLLNALDALIAKKRAIKQAAMQQLLTGKTRLPGFSGEWETKRLGELGNCLRGVSYDPTTDLSSYDKDSTVRLLRANNIQDAVVTLDEVQYVEARRVSEFQVMQPDDILVCMANGSKELVGKAGLFRVRDSHTYTFGAFIGCFRVDPTITEPSFVFYLFQTHGFRNFINLILAGSSINNLKSSDIESAEFKVPNRNEQTTIISVLSDMDAEIAALEQRRDKTRAIKQGMMQQLLTRRVRLSESLIIADDAD